MTRFQPNPKSKESLAMLHDIWVELFQRVGLPTDAKKMDKFMRQTNWQDKKTWTVSQRADFETWLGKYLVMHRQPPGAARDILRRYGWRVAE